MHREGSLCGPLPVEPGLCRHLCVMASQPEVPQPRCAELLLGPCFIGMTNCPHGISVCKSPAAGPGAHTLHHLVTACLAQGCRQLQITLRSWRPRPDLFRGRVSGYWISGSAGSFDSKLLNIFLARARTGNISTSLEGNEFLYIGNKSVNILIHW